MCLNSSRNKFYFFEKYTLFIISFLCSLFAKIYAPGEKKKKRQKSTDVKLIPHFEEKKKGGMSVSFSKTKENSLKK